MSKIEWTTKTWNPIVGCSKVSPGCDHCYAMADSPHRFAAKYDRDGVVMLNTNPKRPGLTFVPTDPKTGKSIGKGAQWTGEVRLLPHVLDVPLRRRKPTTYFVNSLADMFHEAIVDCEVGRRFIAAIFGVMAASPQHTFQVLTKRPHKAREWFDWIANAKPDPDNWVDGRAPEGPAGVIADELFQIPHSPTRDLSHATPALPLPNVWIGTSVEDQERADERIPKLLRVPAAVRFLSCEPLLGPLDFRLAPGGGMGMLAGRCGDADGDCGDNSCSPRVDWIIAGGESGPKARPCDTEWIRVIVEQCKAAKVPCFVKQLGARPRATRHEWPKDDRPLIADGIARLDSAKGGDPAEWPEDLRVREMPEPGQ